MSVEPHPGEAAPPRVLGGRWQVVEKLAEGGMGQLYVARHRQTGRRAALKVIPRKDDEALARFRLEASVAAEVDHPAIVEVYDADFDEASASCYIAMELLHGRTLREVMDDEASTPRQVIDLLLLVLEPLAQAHDKGFVHRDLKPENVFVIGGAGASLRVKLLDFGIAAAPGDVRLTRVGTAMGTPHYMSPEQAVDARTAGPASDVWSIGVMLYEAISGDVPFSAETSQGVAVAVCATGHAPLDGRTAGVDAEVARLVDRCLSKRPQDRPPHAGALLVELAGMLGPSSLPAGRASRRAHAAAPQVSGLRTRSSVTPGAGRARSAFASERAPLLAVSGSAIVLGGAVYAIASGPPGLLGAALAACGALLGVQATRRAPVRAPALAEAPPSVARRSPANDGALPPAFPTLGDEGAKLRIELFADLACAKSRRACQRALSLRAEHADDVCVVFRPLADGARDGSELAAALALDVYHRGGGDAFAAYFDRVTRSTRKLSQELLVAAAAAAGAPAHAVQRALRARVHDAALASSRADAAARGVSTTPTLVVNGVVLEGEPTEDRLRWALRDAVACAQIRELPAGAARTQLADVAPAHRARGVLVRYSGARNAPLSLRRTREQAFERADKLRTRVALPAADFGALALRFGDRLLEPDEVSALPDARVADACARLPPRGVSAPIESDEGYLVLQRVAGAR